jgi:sulfatase modifying factor 1
MCTITAMSAPPFPRMQWVPGGQFRMGSDWADYPEEAPVHEVTVEGFWADETPVTVTQFRRFVKATGYVTVAERPMDPADYPDADPTRLVPSSLVFTPTQGPVDLTNWQGWWRLIPGANWAHPEGPGSGIDGRELHPVTHVSWEDVHAYARWAGKELPTEAEWERAARGGLNGAPYAWGDQLAPMGTQLANYWIGEFPWQNLKPVADRRTTAVRSYPPNGYGLYDVTGNVWEWTADFYRTDHSETATHACCGPAVDPRVASAEGSHDPSNPAGTISRRVIKGGSHLCAENYCRRYRPAARQAQPVDSGMSHIGFRCIVRGSAPTR